MTTMPLPNVPMASVTSPDIPTGPELYQIKWGWCAYDSPFRRHGQALWDWLNEREWEGIISKRLDSPYTEGKKHKDWFKKRKEVRLVADVVGIKLKDGRVS